MSPPIWEMDIHLDLSVHCIETELKRLYHQAVSAFFKADDQNKVNIESIIEALQQILETVDFPSLRAEYPALAGGTDTKVLFFFGGAPPVIRVDHTEIHLEEKCRIDRSFF